MEGGDEDMEVNMGGKTHYGGVKNVVTLYCFPRVSMFELQPW